ncbi:MAG: DegV family protein [Erysipelotrichaceae bacterium]|nr:DegV family protein [Erysipelotrichaceae bacterium]
MRIIFDTTCHISKEEAAVLNVRLVANQVMIGETTFKDYIDIDSKHFVELIKYHHPHFTTFCRRYPDGVRRRDG